MSPLEVFSPVAAGFGSRVREDRLEFQDAGLFSRALNLPVEVGG